MAKFLKGNELNAELEKIIETAEQQILLISPYIKLHDRYKSSLLIFKENPEVEIVVLFGKNEDDVTKSINADDLEFLIGFPNIKIRYEKRLHAKYYANERKALLTSMNLYDFSQNNNIEAGILMESSFKGSFTGDNEMDGNTWSYFNQVIDQSVLLYNKEPQYERKGILGGKKYVNSSVVLDKLPGKYQRNTPTSSNSKSSGARSSWTRTKSSSAKKPAGYCIRTGKEIPFNPKQPMCEELIKVG
jgi:hypothetical protein